LENIPFNLKNVLDKVYNFISHAAEEKMISLTVSAAFPAGQAVIGDPVRIQQVLINLVNNAIKFTPTGGVDISCTLLGKTGETATYEFAVTDTGIGISEENLRTIFEKFKQEDESVTRVYGGTGLGLAISRQLVGLMGGNLRVESRKGQGSRFFFTLELATTDATILAEVNRKIFIDPEALRGKYFLLVEDNEFNQFIARSILMKWNIRVDIAANGKEAIGQVSQNKYDLILMDMQMPVMDGLTATRYLRDTMHIKTPVIALTAFATKEAIVKSRMAGMNGYITKPFEEETLYAELLSVFGIQPSYITGTQDNSLTSAEYETGPVLQYDLNKLSKLLGDDRNEMIEVLEKFIELTPGYSDSLFSAFGENDIEGVYKAAHKIKSSLEFIVVGTLRTNILLITDYAKTSQNLEALPGLVSSFMEGISLLMSQLGEEVRELKRL
jgi:CheY-like chemotaxis protein/HPt (histidine-containing phosphotransfer) domain-containing protein